MPTPRVPDQVRAEAGDLADRLQSFWTRHLAPLGLTSDTLFIASELLHQLEENPRSLHRRISALHRVMGKLHGEWSHNALGFAPQREILSAIMGTDGLWETARTLDADAPSNVIPLTRTGA